MSIISTDFAKPIFRALLTVAFAFVLLIPISWPTHAASFDCRTAKHSNEKLICQSTELSSLDDQMVAIFNYVISVLNRADSGELKQSQRRWLRERLDWAMSRILLKLAERSLPSMLLRDFQLFVKIPVMQLI